MKKRPQNWPVLLHNFLTLRMNQPFIWGTSDCVTTPADWLIALEYPDPIADLRGQWSSPLGAARITKANGGFVNVVNTRLRDIGCPITRPGFAQRGDIALVREPSSNRVLVGICDTGCIFCPGPAGLIRVPANSATHVWRT